MAREIGRYSILDITRSALKAAGIPREAVASRAGLPPDAGPGYMLTAKQYFAVWDAVADLSGDPAIGFRIASMVASPSDTSHVYGMLPASLASTIHARDFMDAMRRIVRFRITAAPREILVEERGSTVVFQIQASRPEETGREVPHAIVDGDFYGMLLLLRRGTGRNLFPLSVELARRPGSEKLLQQYYGCPVTCGAARNAMVLSREDAFCPFPDYNRELFDLLTGHEANADSSGFMTEANWIVDSLLSGGRPKIGDVAAQMAIGKRTFQRMLKSSGTTFQKIVAERRRCLAQEYLMDAGLNLSEVSRLLGFDSQNSFSRFFRECFGCSPSEWRASHRKD